MTATAGRVARMLRWIRGALTRRWSLPSRGAAVGAVVYFAVLACSLLGEGTLDWAYPDDECVANEEVARGVRTYPDCPTMARVGWAQHATNFPVRFVNDRWPSKWLRPQELRLPPRGDEKTSWSRTAWLLTGVLSYATLGALCGAVVSVALRLVRRRRRSEPARDRRWLRIVAPPWAVALGVLAVRETSRAVLPPEPTIAPHDAPKIRALTRGPKFHFFGYYDKLQLDPSDRYVLGLEVEFDKRAVQPGDKADVGMVDLDQRSRWIKLGESRAWNWQQGCMLQWIPGSASEIIWNDRESDAPDAPVVARILDVWTRKRRTLPHPIYTITPDGKTALSLNFARLFRGRPTYGYPGAPDPHEGEHAPADDGIYTVDMQTGERRLIVSLADAYAFGRHKESVPQEEHYFEMLQLNPSATRFVFYERWFAGPMRSRVFTANLDGSDMFLLTAEHGNLSHVDWLDDEHVVLYTTAHRGYALYEDKRGYVSTLLESSRDGHESFLPGNEWMVSDTYADDERLQHPFLFHLPSRTIFGLAHLGAPKAYDGVLRCDNHPRISRDGRKIVVDSAHYRGRQMYMIDMGPILDAVGQ